MARGVVYTAYVETERRLCEIALPFGITHWCSLEEVPTEGMAGAIVTRGVYISDAAAASGANLPSGEVESGPTLFDQLELATRAAYEEQKKATIDREADLSAQMAQRDAQIRQLQEECERNAETTGFMSSAELLRAAQSLVEALDTAIEESREREGQSLFAGGVVTTMTDEQKLTITRAEVRTSAMPLSHTWLPCRGPVVPPPSSHVRRAATY